MYQCILIVMFVILIEPAQAQSGLFVRPNIGLQRYFGYLSGQYDRSTMKINSWNEALDYSLHIEYKYAERYRISLGYTGFALSGTSVRLRTNSINGIEMELASAIQLRQIQSRFSYIVPRPWQAIPRRRTDKTSKVYRLNGRVEFFSGLDVAFLKPVDTLPDRVFSFDSGPDTLRTHTRYHLLRSGGVSLTLGVSVRFNRRGKERMMMSVFYRQGFRPHLQQTITYYASAPARTVQLQTDVLSRGSVLALNLSYPLRLYGSDRSTTTLP